jgi:hypothetical protein
MGLVFDMLKRKLSSERRELVLARRHVKQEDRVAKHTKILGLSLHLDNLPYRDPLPLIIVVPPLHPHPPGSLPQCLLQVSLAQESLLHDGVQADLRLQVHPEEDLQFGQVTSSVKSVQERGRTCGSL